VPTSNRPSGLVNCVGVALPFAPNRAARDGASSYLLPTAWIVACKGYRPRTPRRPNSTDANFHPGLSAGQHWWIASPMERLMSDDCRLGRVIRACHESCLQKRKIETHTLDRSYQYTHFDQLPIFSTCKPMKMAHSSYSPLPQRTHTTPYLALPNPVQSAYRSASRQTNHPPTQRHGPPYSIPSHLRSRRHSTAPSRSRTSLNLGTASHDTTRK
jgi:hypothetical protein